MADTRISVAGFDLDQTDRLLSTTRAVRKRLDFDRPVSDEVIFDCIDLAEQAPTGGNDASRRWIVARDQAIKDQLGDLYRQTGQVFARARQRLVGTGHPKEKVVSSSAYLVENMAGIPPGVTTVVTFPVAYTKGTEFSAVPRRPASEITYFDQWGFTRQRPSVDGTARVADGQGVVAEIDTEARPSEGARSLVVRAASAGP